MKQTRPGILVIGDVMTDIIVRPLGKMVRGADCPAEIGIYPGGSGANQAVWLGSIGANVTFAGMVGQTGKGMYDDHFASFGVKAHLSSSPDHSTGQLVVMIDETGERSFLTDRGANDALRAEHLPFSLLDNIQHLHISAYSIFEQGPREAVARLMDEAKRRGMSISMDGASSSCLEAIGLETFFAVTRHLDLVVVNEQEAISLTLEWQPDAQLAALSRRYPYVLLKRGMTGADLSHPGGLMHRDAVAATCVDSTGAGDAFFAGFLSCFVRGEPLEVALDKAVTMGAMAVEQSGAQPKAMLHGS